MHVLITGADGFVGHYLRSELEQHSHQVSCLSGPPSPGHSPLYPVMELRDAGSVSDCIAKLQPDACIHLAGIASSTVCEKNPALAFEVNVAGTLNILSAFATHAPDAHLLLVSTTQVYGNQPAGLAVTEDAALQPITMYALSKAAMEQAAKRFADQNKLAVTIVRPENHIGPGQSAQYVVSAFAQQLAQMAAGTSEKTMWVGNLDSTRDFSDVRDVVRAYRLLLEEKQAGRTFNIASGTPMPIGHLLDELIDLSGVSPRIEQDPAFWRPTDQAMLVSTAAIREAIHWSPEIPLRTSLKDILTSLQPA